MEGRFVSLGREGEGKVGITKRGSEEERGERDQRITNSRKEAGKRNVERRAMMSSTKV